MVILRFSVQNYLSFDEEQEISFIASKLRDRDDGLIDLGHVSSGLQGLPVAVVYGANASGKSNLLQAISNMRQLVLFSHRASGPGEGIKRSFFALRSDCKQEETKFSIDFLLNNVRYHYGFSFDNEMYREEWLYFYPEGSRRVLFEREAGESIKFGPSFRGEKKTLENLTRENSLFVSVAAQNNHDVLGEVFQFFQRTNVNMDVYGQGGIFQINTGEIDIDKRSINFLSLIGTGITGFRRQKKQVSDEAIGIRGSLSKIIDQYIGGKVSEEYLKYMSNYQDVEFEHQGDNGTSSFLKIAQESSGTRRLISLLNHVFYVLDQGGFIAIDEVDVSVHSQATEAIIALFSNKETNPNGAQLLATTHDTNLMNSKVLRRDEIWLVEKNRAGMSQLFPLTDIRTRKQDNIEKGYLEGRYGAVPMVDIHDLIAEVGCGAEKS
ncbi:ATP/GTP-binding protein [Thalassospira sp. MCCC 1A03138]|uniref:AAA family ATPase n=1 Tax=Thalassospira sp. MCCC 1A03138 TaxID=1470576 RepID=UPI000A1F4AA4|nr:ATP-binding protein [Thalassospira sp. MCCC 1A03138]OSQ32250.1 hypothetical protein TH468_01020 [Thalassospira sp. MCCC 1A03138]